VTPFHDLQRSSRGFLSAVVEPLVSSFITARVCGPARGERSLVLKVCSNLIRDQPPFQWFSCESFIKGGINPHFLAHYRSGTGKFARPRSHPAQRIEPGRPPAGINFFLMDLGA
jgi:hypothetical protein